MAASAPLARMSSRSDSFFDRTFPPAFATLRSLLCNSGRNTMNPRTTLTIMSLLATSMLAAAGPTLAAEVTPERLAAADKEPQNWLMNHRTYDSQRYSPLDKINHG